MLPPARLRLLVGALAIWTCLVWIRLAQIQLVEHASWRSEAEGQSERSRRVREARGEIRTQDGRLLAGALSSVSLCCNPSRIPARQWERVAEELAPLVGLPPAEVLDRFRQERGFFYLAKELDPSVVPKVAGVRQRGVWTERTERRIYPHGELAGPVVGFVDAEGTGQAGLERFYDKTLSGIPSEYRLLCDGKSLPTAIDLRLVKAGRPGRALLVSIDSRVQLVVEQELERALGDVGAEGGAAVVLDPWSGELLALASLPAYDPGEPGAVSGALRRNRAVENAIEPGSVFKPVVVAAALASGVLEPWELVDCSGGGVEVGGIFMRDHAAYGLLPVTEVIAKSSNAGAIRIAHRVGAAQLDDVIRAFGFGERSGIELPAETPGLYRGPQSWSALSRAGLALGEEIAVSAVQVAKAYGVFATGGLLAQPRLVLETSEPDGGPVVPYRRQTPVRVLAAPVAAAVREMLVAAVEHGTGTPAQVPGQRVAGKTGTAQKPGDEGLRSGLHASWFAGFFPADHARAVIVVVIDEPRSAFWANEVAAPVFGRIAARMATLLGIPPVRPEAA